MNASYNQFIGKYENVYSDGFCKHLIDEYEKLINTGAGWNRQDTEKAFRHHKDDFSLSLNMRPHLLEPFLEKNCVNYFFDGLQTCYLNYADKYSTLNEFQIRTSDMKMQRTSPGGGYHVWHSEQGPGEHSSRVLTFILYLNTLQPEEAGETEFLYQQLRVQPVENTLCIWPAAYTHVHRGNPVYGNNYKYIITGWFHIE